MHRPSLFIIIFVLCILMPEGTGIITRQSDDFDSAPIPAPGVSGSLSGASAAKSVAGLPAADFSRNLLNDTWEPLPDTHLLFLKPPGPNSVDGVPIFPIPANHINTTTANNGYLLGSIPYGWWKSGLDEAFGLSDEPALSLAQSTWPLKEDFHSGGIGWQGESDESWGIEKPSVPVNTSLSSVPEPATILLLGASLLAIAALSRIFRK